MEVTPKGPLGSGSTANEEDGSSKLLILHAILSEENSDCLMYEDSSKRSAVAIEHMLLSSCAFPPALHDILLNFKETQVPLGNRVLKIVESHKYESFLRPHFTQWHADEMNTRVEKLLSHLDKCELIIPRL